MCFFYWHVYHHLVDLGKTFVSQGRLCLPVTRSTVTTSLRLTLVTVWECLSQVHQSFLSILILSFAGAVRGLSTLKTTTRPHFPCYFQSFVFMFKCFWGTWKQL